MPHVLTRLRSRHRAASRSSGTKPPVRAAAGVATAWPLPVPPSHRSRRPSQHGGLRHNMSTAGCRSKMRGDYGDMSSLYDEAGQALRNSPLYVDDVALAEIEEDGGSFDDDARAAVLERLEEATTPIYVALLPDAA